jgi:hypothetical protein
MLPHAKEAEEIGKRRKAHDPFVYLLYVTAGPVRWRKKETKKQPTPRRIVFNLRHRLQLSFPISIATKFLRRG